MDTAERDSEWLLRVMYSADLAHSRAKLIETFSGSVLPQGLADAMTRFVESPSVETALELVAAEPAFLALFAGSSASANFVRGQGGDPALVQPSAATLRGEPGFRALLNAFLEDRVRFKELSAEFVDAGYPQAVIDKAVTQHFEDLA